MIISSKFVGPATYRNCSTGEFWAVLPELTKDAERLQQRLIGFGKELAQSRNVVAHAGRKPLRGPHDSE